jgi:ABC-type sulfate transport system permease component
LHRRVALALETIHGDALATVCSQIAVHNERAGAADQAIAYYRRAVAAANQLGAYAEMVEHLHKTLALLDALPATPARIEQKADALLSLGATRYEMTKVILRQLMPGIVTAILLAVGRGIGDAATVLFTAGYTDNIPQSLNQPAATLPLSIFFQLGSPVEEVQNRAYASAVILTVIILILSFSARYFSSKFAKHKI